MDKNISMAISNPDTQNLNIQQRLALALVAIGLLALFIAWVGMGNTTAASLPMYLVATIGVGAGSIWYAMATYNPKPEGIKNDGVFFKSLTARGAFGWMLGVLLTGFYFCLYWHPQYLEGLIRLHDPLSFALREQAADQWFVYGTFYTLAVLLMGFKFLRKYRHNKYQRLRTFSVMFFQLGFAFLIPAILVRLNQPELYPSYFWPLDYDALFPSKIDEWMSAGNVGMFMVFWGAILTFIGTPILTYFYGKRWYCSWVCGCGGLAETAGDPFRHLSDKSLFAWQVERILIHSILLIITLITVLLWVNNLWENSLLGGMTAEAKKGYGFLIGSMFSGVIGTGFYPILGNRAWCRFGCPMAAFLGIIQKFKSRFRITTNGGQCISCGNCSTYCEMGIDVRHYAQRGQDVVRASCVGCGICAAVCPRGVLRLENGTVDIDERAIDVRNVHIQMDEVEAFAE